MNPLLGLPDPVLRDDVAYSAAERWILRDKVVSPDDLRTLIKQWTTNLDNGLGEAGDDRVFGRSFSALCLSVIAAADLSAPFLTADEADALFGKLLAYFSRERDLRGFDPVKGWMHTVARRSRRRILSSPGARTIAWRWRCSRRCAGRMPMRRRWTRGPRTGWRHTRRCGRKDRT
jgi:hypothetical protein